jgi:hypothetical protein
MSFGMYELWGLIDDCHFVIDDVKFLILFTKHDKIGKFVNYGFNMRTAAKTKGENLFWKNMLNSSYGSDGMNNEKFTNVKFLDRKKALKAVVNYNFMNSTMITDDLYLVEKDPTSASCNKPLQSAFATLSNAKFFYNLFVYQFTMKCLDEKRFHFVVTDTDSYMWAVADTGKRKDILNNFILKNISEKSKGKLFKGRIIIPHFEDIVSDREFYETNYKHWFPKKKSLLTLK